MSKFTKFFSIIFFTNDGWWNSVADTKRFFDDWCGKFTIHIAAWFFLFGRSIPPQFIGEEWNNINRHPSQSQMDEFCEVENIFTNFVHHNRTSLLLFSSVSSIFTFFSFKMYPIFIIEVLKFNLGVSNANNRELILHEFFSKFSLLISRKLESLLYSSEHTREICIIIFSSNFQNEIHLWTAESRKSGNR